jgi:hemerythrin
MEVYLYSDSHLDDEESIMKQINYQFTISSSSRL